MRILIAGCGYVGTALGEALAASGHEVFGLRRRVETLPAAILPVAADLSRPETLRAIPTGADLVFYTAAAGGGDDASYRAAYVDGLRNLLDALAAHPPRLVLFTSSTGVYAQEDGEWVDEDSPAEPVHFSGRRLLEGERLLAASGIGAVVLRLGGIYGPGRTRLIDSVRGGRAQTKPGVPVYTNRIHRDDCVGALVHLAFAESPAPLYLGVDHEPAEESEVLRWLAARLGVPAPREAKPAREEMPPGAVAQRGRSNKRCRNARLEASGYQFRFPSFREGYEAVLRGMGLVLTALLLPSMPVGAAQPQRPPAWQARIDAGHPLVGVIWDVTAGEAISPATLAARLAHERIVLLGERHDHPDHHALQAWIVGALVEAGRRPVVAFEMFDASQQAALDQHLLVSPLDAAGLGLAAGWEKTGWPDWTLYRPIAEAALAGGLGIRSANLDREQTRALSRDGVEALDPALVERLGLGTPLPEEQRLAIESEIVEGHCGHAPAKALPRMVLVQRARDAQMASALREAAGAGDGAVLIAGNGHVRRDHGVPARLLEQDPFARAATVSILEVIPERETPEAYVHELGLAGPASAPAAGRPQRDYLWFTPRLDDEDACAKFQRELEGMKRGS